MPSSLTRFGGPPDLFLFARYLFFFISFFFFTLGLIGRCLRPFGFCDFLLLSACCCLIVSWNRKNFLEKVMVFEENWEILVVIKKKSKLFYFEAKFCILQLKSFWCLIGSRFLRLLLFLYSLEIAGIL